MQKIRIPLKSPTCSTQVGTYMAEVLLVNEVEVLVTEVQRMDTGHSVTWPGLSNCEYLTLRQLRVVREV